MTIRHWSRIFCHDGKDSGGCVHHRVGENSIRDNRNRVRNLLGICLGDRRCVLQLCCGCNLLFCIPIFCFSWFLFLKLKSYCCCKGVSLQKNHPYPIIYYLLLSDEKKVLNIFCFVIERK